MTCSYEMLEGAKSDFEAIVSYLRSASDGPSAARSFVEEFEGQLQLVCENPGLYALSRMPELAVLGYRAALVGAYVMLYFLRDDTIYVAHVFHQRQDYARLV